MSENVTILMQQPMTDEEHAIVHCRDAAIQSVSAIKVIANKFAGNQYADELSTKCDRVVMDLQCLYVPRGFGEE